MKTERRNFDETPERIGEGDFDCVWVRLGPRDNPSPLRSRALQWLDWQLQGKLSAHIASGERYKETTFLPTMRKFPVPYIAIDAPTSADWEAFLRNCEGLKLKRVLYYCEDATQAQELERELKSHKAEFPEFVSFGSDTAEAGAR